MPCQNCSALPSHHDLDPEFKVFYGMASPPTSYGGYGGNANEKPKYTFEYPKSWKSEQPSKVLLPLARYCYLLYSMQSDHMYFNTLVRGLYVTLCYGIRYTFTHGCCTRVQSEKGTKGIDGRVVSPKSKGTSIAHLVIACNSLILIDTLVYVCSG